MKLPDAPPKFYRALAISQVLAVVCWLAALYFQSTGKIAVWYDQQTTFTQLASHWRDPYVVPGFINPPWTVLLLLPFGLIPVPLAVLIQQCLYFGLLTAVIYKFTGGQVIRLGRFRFDRFAIVLIVLTSFFALDSGIELSLEWIVCIGLLVPAAYSGPLLLVKPQDALGVVVSYRWRDVLRTGILTLAVVLASFALWGEWITPYLDSLRRASYYKSYNLAPSAIIGWIPALAIGLLLMAIAFRRRDPVLCVLAWQFFVPYSTLYILMLPFAIAATRFPRVALLISVTMWILYGRIALLTFLGS
ncbi:MAG TPA: hypothetical protein VMT34_01195 [Aggregatilineales bacterium]|nr:hypothetical protein [Aggregatilineales bacterium]